MQSKHRKKKYPDPKLHVKREKDILSLWYYYVLMIKNVLKTLLVSYRHFWYYGSNNNNH